MRLPMIFPHYFGYVTGYAKISFSKIYLTIVAVLLNFADKLSGFSVYLD